MRAFFSILLISISTACFSQGQDFSKHYSPLVCKGLIPDEFISSSKSKYIEDLASINKSESKTDRKIKKDFILESNYAIDNVLSKGTVLFGDSVTNYINKVADQLLKNNQKLRSELRFYTLSSTEVNAFATNQGIIFVSIGLISQLVNEAQLAFILAHEISHYTQKHVINSYVKNQKLNKDRDFKKLNYEDKISEIVSYSHEHEMEADELGLKLFLESEYSIEHAKSVFDVLKYAHLPFDEIRFDPGYFETENYILPARLFLKKINEIKDPIELDDSKRSHPKISTRINNLEKKITQSKSKGGSKEYIVSKQEFLEIRWISRFEIARLQMINREYLDAIYSAYLILNTYSENIFAKTIIAKSLLYLSYHHKGKFDYYIDDNNKVIEIDIKKENERQGEIQRLQHLITFMNNEEIALLGLKQQWELYFKHGDNYGIKSFAESSLENYVKRFNRNTDFFKSDPIAVEEKDKIINNSLVSENEPSQFALYSFVELKKHDKFNTAYNKTLSKVKKEKELEKKFKEMNYREKFKLEKKIAKSKKKGYALGIDKVMILNPFFFSIDITKDFRLKQIESEKKKETLVNRISKNAEICDLEVEVFDAKYLNSDNVDMYNEMAIIRTWVTENLENMKLGIVSSESYRIAKIAEKYETPYLYLTGVVYFTAYDYSALWGILFLQLGILAEFKQRDLMFITIVFDVVQNKPVFIDNTHINNKDSRDYMNLYIYHNLNQIKRKSRK
jgi:beta-barrel assembly-enhancing protease